MKKIKLLLLSLALSIAGFITGQNALHFDGADDYVQTTYNGVLGTANRTFEAWIYFDGTVPATTMNILDYGLNATGARNTFIVASNGKLGFVSGGTNANLYSTNTALFSANIWTHVAFVLDNGTGYLYVDGVQVGTGNLSGVNTPLGADMTIGQRVSGGNTPFNGTIDEVRVWNVARTATEIAADMNNAFTCGVPTGLVAYHKFDQGTAGGSNTGLTTSNDELGNDGTLTNFALTGATSNWVAGQTLTANPVPIAGMQTLNECNGFSITIGTNTYNTTGIYTDTLVGVALGGCDSVLTTDLTISFDITTSINGSVITANENGATYQWLDCNNNNAYIVGETNQTFIPTANGSYAVEITSAASCVDTSNCETLTGAVILNENALHFDGVDDYVELTSYKGISGTAARTIEAWIKVPVGAEGNIVSWGTNAVAQKWVFRIQSSHGQAGALRAEVNGGYYVGSTDLRDNQWHHVAVTWENDGTPSVIDAKLYVDGVLETSSAALSGAVNTANGDDVLIGAHIGGTQLFSGTMDEVRIWDYARTQTEITTEMNNEFACGNPEGLVAYHKFNHGIASGANPTETTSTGELGNDGTLTGFALTGATSNWVTGQTLIEKSFPIAGAQTLNECDGFTITINGNTYSTTGIYVDTLVGAAIGGCDSVLTTNLTIGVDVSTTITGSMIAANEAAATYQWIDCNNNMVYIAGETNQSYTAIVNGSYAVEVTSTVSGCIDTSMCENIAVFTPTNNALHFDGVDDNITTSFAGLTGNVNLTIEAWINAPLTTGEVVILDAGTVGTRTQFAISLVNGYIKVDIGGGNSYTFTTGLVADNTWHHISVTYNKLWGMPYRVNIDGVQEGSQFNLGQRATTSSPLVIGKGIDNTRYFNGMIDEVRIWKLWRSATTIGSEMNTQFCGPQTSLIAYHKLNHGIANGANPTVTASTDASGLGWDGTLNGFALTGTTSNWVEGPVLNASYISDVQTLNECAGDTVIVGNSIYTTSGTYQDVFVSGLGCDSVVTTFLTIANPIASSQTLSECDGFSITVGSNTYTATGVYTDVLTATNSCDSTVTTNLTVAAAIASTQTLSECDGFSITVGTNTYTNTGIYTDVLTAANTCDSTVTTDLTVAAAIDINTTTAGLVITADATSATYQWIDCNNNNAYITGETGQSYTVTASGDYAVEITVGNCVDTSACVNMTTVGIDMNNVNNGVAIFPNPTSNSTTVTISNNSEIASIYVIDLTGKIVLKKMSSNNTIELDLSSFEKGIYFIKIIAGENTSSTKLIKL